MTLGKGEERESYTVGGQTSPMDVVTSSSSRTVDSNSSSSLWKWDIRDNVLPQVTKLLIESKHQSFYKIMVCLLVVRKVLVFHFHFHMLFHFTALL